MYYYTVVWLFCFGYREMGVVIVNLDRGGNFGGSRLMASPEQSRADRFPTALAVDSVANAAPKLGQDRRYSGNWARSASSASLCTRELAPSLGLISLCTPPSSPGPNHAAWLLGPGFPLITVQECRLSSLPKVTVLYHNDGSKELNTCN
jgi:hypothetical protein